MFIFIYKKYNTNIQTIMEDSQSILSQLQQKKADIERQLQKMQGLDDLSGEDEEEPEEQDEEQEEDTKEPEDTKEEPEKPVVADYRSDKDENDDRLARKVEKILESKLEIKQCQKHINKLVGEVKAQLDDIMDAMDDCKSIDRKDLEHLSLEYTELMQEFSLCYMDAIEGMSEGVTLPKSYIEKVEKQLDAIEEDVNKYLA